MKRVLVTGAETEIGRRLLARLVEHDIEPVAFFSEPPTESIGGDYFEVVGDVSDIDEVGGAVVGVEAAIHLTPPSSGSRGVNKSAEVLAEACAVRGVHLLYPSLVGADQSGLPNLKARWKAEQSIVGMPGLGWTIQRTTFTHRQLAASLQGQVWPLPGAVPVQPVAGEDVAARLVGLLQAGPSGRVTEYGGPELMTFADAVGIYKQVRGRAPRRIPIPRVGPFKEAIDGLHATPDGDRGRVTFREWLEANAAA